MKLEFKPKTKEDWRLLLELAKCIRLATRKEIYRAVKYMQDMNKNRRN